jgi:hypothetical protein
MASSDPNYLDPYAIPSPEPTPEPGPTPYSTPYDPGQESMNSSPEPSGIPDVYSVPIPQPSTLEEMTPAADLPYPTIGSYSGPANPPPIPESEPEPPEPDNYGSIEADGEQPADGVVP